MDDDVVNPTAEPVDDVEKLDAVVNLPSGIKAAPAPERLGTEKSLGRRRQR
jgi:hypothetical protein